MGTRLKRSSRSATARGLVRSGTMTIQAVRCIRPPGLRFNPPANRLPNPAVLPRRGSQAELAAHKKTPVLQGFAAGCEVVQSGRVEDRGLEPGASSCRNTGVSETRAAESGAVGAEMTPDDPRLLRIVSAWSRLPEAIRSAMVAVLDAADKTD